MTTRLLYPCYIHSPEFFVLFLAFNFCPVVCGFEFLVFCVVFVLLASVTLKLRLHLTHYILPMYYRSTCGRTRCRFSNDPFLYR